jgi:hypothetical protein
VPRFGKGFEESIESFEARSVECPKLDTGGRHKRRWRFGVYTHAGPVVSGLSEEFV